jgi:hypothetical protein
MFLCLLGASSKARADCIYAGQPYGENSSLKQADGVSYVCKGNAWVYERSAISVEAALLSCFASSFHYTQQAKDKCDGKSICEVDVNEWAKDTCNPLRPGTGVSLRIDYHCDRAKIVPIPNSKASASALYAGVVEVSCAPYD